MRTTFTVWAETANGQHTQLGTYLLFSEADGAIVGAAHALCALGASDTRLGVTETWDGGAKEVYLDDTTASRLVTFPPAPLTPRVSW